MGVVWCRVGNRWRNEKKTAAAATTTSGERREERANDETFGTTVFFLPLFPLDCLPYHSRFTARPTASTIRSGREV